MVTLACMLPLAFTWRVRCGGCGHRGEAVAPLSDLAVKQLRCDRCGHRQTFAPEFVVAPRRVSAKRRARGARGPAIIDGVSRTPPKIGAPETPNIGSPEDPVFNDRLDDLFADVGAA
jgi:hypothetical protein